MVFFSIVCLSFFAATCFDNSFNYYIRDQFGFPSSYNGYIKAAIGLVGLTANFTVNVYLARRTQARKSIIPVMLACALALLAVPVMPGVGPFVAVSILYYACSTIYQPIQQTLISQEATQSGGALYGAFNTSRTIGMVGGSLFAGLIYVVGKKLPFYFFGRDFPFNRRFVYRQLLSVQKRRPKKLTDEAAAAGLGPAAEDV